jgi:outer membrane protein assembly factor BamB
MIYFAEEAGVVYAYPADSSSMAAPGAAWMRVTHGRILHSPVVLEDLLLVGSDEGDFWALNRITGRVEWSVMSGAPIYESPAASGDQVYFSNSRGFHAYDRTEGVHKWTYEMGGRFIVRRPEAVYVEVAQGVVHALDVKTGEKLRKHNFGEGHYFLTNMADGTFFMVTDHGFLFLVDIPLD